MTDLSEKKLRQAFWKLSGEKEALDKEGAKDRAEFDRLRAQQCDIDMKMKPIRGRIRERAEKRGELDRQIAAAARALKGKVGDPI